MIEWLSGDASGPHEQALPGEWAMLVLIIVAGAALGFLVLWFTMLHHERTVLHRARPHAAFGPGLLGLRPTGGEFEPIAEADAPGGNVEGAAVGDAAPVARAYALGADGKPDTDVEPEADVEPEPAGSSGP